MARNRTAEYWKKRFEQIEQAQHQQGVQCYTELEQQYRQAQKQLEAQIQAWYGRFASNNGVSIQDARRMLTNRELAELKWDINEYIRYGQENALSGTWIKELENASARWHISRLEALKLQTQQQIEVLFGNQVDSIDAAMKSIYTSGYYHTAFEVQKGFGVGWDFATLDEKQIAKVINKPWAVDGKNFSDRIWQNKQKLVNELNTTLTQNIILGKDPQKAIDEIARKLNTSKTNAGRLVMTEEAFFSSAAQKDCFTELDVEQFEVVATLDSHTSEICQGMDGQHFPMSQWEVGVTAPPFHVNCRTTTVPFFGDEFDLIGERAARGEDGKTYHVPENMTYPEWKKSFVDNKPGYDNFDITEGGKYQRINTGGDKNAYADRIEHEYTTQRMTVKEVNQLWDKNVGYIQALGYSDINEYLRGLKPKLDVPKRNVTINVLKQITNNNALVNDYVGVRKVDMSYLKNVLGIDTDNLLKTTFRRDGMGRRRGQLVPKSDSAAQSIVDRINALVGTPSGTITDKAFTSVSLDESLNYFTHYPIKFEIQMPSGTKGMITSNLQESEFIAKCESSIEIIGSKVYNDNGDNCILIYARLKQ